VRPANFYLFFKVGGDTSVYKPPNKPQAYPAAPLKKLSIKLAKLNSPSTVVRECDYSLNHGHQQSEKKREKLKTEKDREFGTEKKDGIQKSL
jgi:hypothetical protein